MYLIVLLFFSPSLSLAAVSDLSPPFGSSFFSCSFSPSLASSEPLSPSICLDSSSIGSSSRGSFLTFFCKAGSERIFSISFS